MSSYTVGGPISEELDRIIMERGTSRQCEAIRIILRGEPAPRTHKNVSPNFLRARENVIQGTMHHASASWVKRTKALVNRVQPYAEGRILLRNIDNLRTELGTQPGNETLTKTKGFCVYVYTRENEAGRIKIGKSSNGWGEVFKQGRGSSFPALPLAAFTSHQHVLKNMEDAFHVAFDEVKVPSQPGDGAGKEWFFGDYDDAALVGSRLSYCLNDLRGERE